MPLPNADQLATLKLLAEAATCAIEVSDHMAALGEQSTLLQVTLDGIRQGVSAFDADLKLITWNARMSELMQLPQGFMRKGLPFEDYVMCLAEKGVYGKGDPRAIVEDRVASLRNAHPYTRDFNFPDGKVVEIRVMPMSTGGVMATYTDATEERRKAADLRAAARRFEIESSIAAIANEGSELGAALRKTLNSLSAILALKYGTILREDGTEGRLHDIGIHYSGSPAIPAIAFEAGMAMAHRARAEGRVVHVGFEPEHAAPEHDERRGIAFPLSIRGELYVLVGMGGARDLQDLWFGQIASALEIHMSRVAERERLHTLKDEFISTMNHEMRTPLTVLKGGLDLLQAGIYGPLPEEAVEAIGMMVENGRRLGDLVDDILDLDSVENDPTSIPFDFVTVDGPAKDAVAVLADTAREQKVAVAVGGTKGLIACTNAARLTQVIRHLLSNAIKFSPPGSQVTVEAQSRKEGVRISVSDQGAGIPEDFRPKMFDKFTQADASDRRRVNGTGLGLAIAKQLVERLKGDLSFESQLGAGTTFHVDLPRSAA